MRYHGAYSPKARVVGLICTAMIIRSKKTGSREKFAVNGVPRRFRNKIMRRLDRLANLGLLSAGMAHEIKNGLVAINTFVDLLLQKGGEDQELSETVRRELRRIDRW